MTRTTDTTTGAGTATHPVPIRVHSHYVSDDPGSNLKEELYLTFAAKWRGRDVTVTMRADRYTVSSWNDAGELRGKRLTDWRVYASEAREAPDDGSSYGAHLTDTARARLGAEYDPAAHAWLASPAYAASESAAYAYMIERELYEMRPTYTDPTHRVRETLDKYRHKLTDGDRDRLSRALDAFDVYAGIVAEGKGEGS